MNELQPGDRVCSKSPGYYYRIPGTIKNIAQFQVSNRPGWDYIVTLDDGREVIINEDDLVTPTDEDVERFTARLERDREMNQRALERMERRAASARATREALAQRGELMAEERRKEREAARLENDQKQRREHAREYGLDSLRQ